MARSLRRLMVLIPMLSSLGAQAMSIGDINVTSHLGEPLRATVPIELDEDTLPGAACVRIVGPARVHPDLSDARLELLGQDRRKVIAISTSKRVGDPVLDLTLRAEGCGPTMQKDFLILLSPRDVAAAPAARPVPPRISRAEPTRPAARTPAPPAARPTTRFALKLDYDDTAFGQLAEKLVQRKQAAYRAAAKRRSQASRLADPLPPYTQGLQTKVEPIPGKPAQGLPESRPVAPMAPAGRPVVPAAPQPSGDRLVLAVPPADFQPAMPGSPEAAATTGDSPPPPEATESAATTGAAARPGGDRGLSAPAPQPDASRRWYAWFLNPYNLLLPLLLILAALAIALWLKQRRPQSRFLDKTAPGLHTLFPADPDEPQPHPLLSRNLPPIEEGFVEPPQAASLLAETLEPRPPSQPVRAMEFTPGIGAKAIESEAFSVEQHDSFDHVMELAEVMLAFGRSGQAIDALSQHIRDNPRQSVDPWFKLLDLYYQSSQRTEFEALAADLHKHYNIAIIEWDQFASSPASSLQDGPLTLESLPHIMSRLTENWGTPAGLDYINKLLADNRGGQRLGFSIPVVRDILLLRDILRQICPVAASSF